MMASVFHPQYDRMSDWSVATLVEVLLGAFVARVRTGPHAGPNAPLDPSLYTRDHLRRVATCRSIHNARRTTGDSSLVR